MKDLELFFLGLLVLYSLLCLTAPKRVSNKILEGFSPIVDNVEIGTALIGSGSTNLITKTVYFKNTFNKAPFVFVQPLYQTNTSLSDVFETSVMMTTESTFRVNIQRIDQNSGWSQQLKLMYVAIEIQVDTPYDKISSAKVGS